MKLKPFLPEIEQAIREVALDNNAMWEEMDKVDNLGVGIIAGAIGEIEVELNWEKIGDILGEMMGYRCNCKPQQECKMCKRMGEIAKSIADNLHSLIRRKGER